MCAAATGVVVIKTPTRRVFGGVWAWPATGDSHRGTGQPCDEREPVHHCIASVIPSNRAWVRHSITRSARCRSDGGIVRPSALAVLRLITSSNVVGLLHRKVAGLGALEDAVDVGCRALVKQRPGAAVRHQAAVFHLRGPLVDRGQPVVRGQLDDSLPVAHEIGVAPTKSAAGRVGHDRGKGASVVAAPNLHDSELDAQRRRRFLHLLPERRKLGSSRERGARSARPAAPFP